MLYNKGRKQDPFGLGYMATPSLLGLPLELREQIYHHVLQQRRPFGEPWSRASFVINASSPASGERTMACLHPAQETAGFRISSDIDLGQTCRQIRIELTSCLRTAVVDLAVDIHDFDYGHAINLLQSLSPKALQTFTVQPDRSTDLTRKLKINLSGPFDDSWTLNLTCWLSVVEDLLGPKDELATAYKIVPNAQWDDVWSRAPFHIVTSLYQMHKNYPSGPARDELFKILLTFWGRYRVEEALRNGGAYTMGNLHHLERAGVPCTA
ncbi:hypothetical protein DOTSEDRAFT_72302 [Dothistroma septosporum NZE10]|uniref:Uncharacterized protein n=1 Tax=Dothistroma septosporum (strain NZE10 / CBS 128990) TaxID=675120 RepID=N1PR32_DOTSN|nr:hypothetical protein DOTSEDRAFT_72302 [Dothistroma septosporum NZE10]